jgi:hypothetical protein
MHLEKKQYASMGSWAIPAYLVCIESSQITMMMHG